MIAFGTKAETLARLARRLRRARVLPLSIVARRAWESKREHELRRVIAQSWSRTDLIVRSSARDEDREGGSRAGKYLSLAGVAVPDLAAAVDRVFASYDRRHREDQVLIQPVLVRPQIAGVAFSRDPASGAPYIAINYDASGDTAAVTSGRGQDLSTHVIVRGRTAKGWLGALLLAIAELERLLGRQNLDVEFAIDRQGRVVLLQVRPLAIVGAPAMSDTDHAGALKRIAARVRNANHKFPNVAGKRTIFGVMPDWNPAEMVGTRPRPLTLSLYKDLITNSIWAYQRNNYGYRNVRSTPLILSLHGLPYVDVRASFSSFVPASISDDLAGRLVDYYVDRLHDFPALHDKVEFEIVFSCYVPDIAAKFAPLRARGFSAGDIRALTVALKDLTNTITHAHHGLWRNDRAKIDMLSLRQSDLSKRRLDPIGHIYWLLEDCKRYGTLPFAGLARAAFIAVQFLRSLKDLGALRDDEHTSYMASVDTITARMHRDLGTLSRRNFLSTYGHLRPGTYDILSPRYDEAPDRYFAFGRDKHPARAKPFALSASSRRKIDHLLSARGMDMTAVDLFAFFTAAIQGREYGKFVFTKSVSDALSALKGLGHDCRLSPDDMSYLDISTIQRIYASALDPRYVVPEAVAAGREAHARTLMINLPPLIRSAEEVWSFEMPPTEPNYVTQLAAEGPIRTANSPVRVSRAASC